MTTSQSIVSQVNTLIARNQLRTTAPIDLDQLSSVLEQESVYVSYVLPIIWPDERRGQITVYFTDTGIANVELS